jgi:uncharacterized cupin superfamily protein
MSVELIVMKTSGAGAPKVQVAKPDPAQLVSGSAVTQTWNHFVGENERLYCGIWESAKGVVKVSYDEWEFCHFIQGEAILTNEDGKSWTLSKGDAFIIPAGFKGKWETVRKVKKHYVILRPDTLPLAMP